jgi:hypothetical protein
MKCVKILFSALVALVAFSALVSTASATTLTSPKGTTYTSTLKFQNAGTITYTSVFGGFGAVSCKQSTLEAKVEQHGAGITVSGAVSAMTFSECNFPTTVLDRGSLEIHPINEKEATVTSKNTKIVWHGTAFGSCTFTTSSTGTDIGVLTTTASTGGKARLDLKGSIPSPCGTATLEGSYEVVTPSTLYVDA